METLLYLAKINVFLAVFYLAYWLLFRNHTFFVWNRFYLLSSLMLALILPSIKFTEKYRPEIANEVYAASAQEVAPVSYPLETQGIDWMMIILICYSIGVLIMFGRLMASFYKLFKTIKQSESLKTGDYTLVLLDNKASQNNRYTGSFSFFKWLVVAKDDYEQNPDVILRHEHVHVQQLHSLDIVLVEFFKVIFWINPVVWLYKNAMQAVHEYLADQNVADREQYAKFLVSYALNTPKSMIANHFFNSSLLKSRIQMIYKNPTPRRAIAKYVLIIPVTLLVVFLTAARERVAEEIPATELAKKNESALVSPDVKSTTNETIDINGTIINEDGKAIPDAIVILAGSTRGVATDKEGKFEFKEIPLDGRLVVSHVNFQSAQVFIDKNKNIYGITLYENPDGTVAEKKTAIKPAELPANDAAGKTPTTTSRVYVIAEQKPQFPGGHDAMLSYLRQSIKYPEPALKANVEGIVFVKFTVDADGTLGDVVIVKGVGFGLDREAIRLVKEMPKWEPAIQNGKPIRASQEIEIKFDLAEGKAKKQQGFLDNKTPEKLFTMDDLGKRFNKAFDFTAIEQVPKATQSDTVPTRYTNYRYTPYKIATPGFVTNPTSSAHKYRTVLKYQKP